MAAQDLAANLINSEICTNNRVSALKSSSHGGSGRNQGRKPAHKPRDKGNTDANLRVLSLSEEKTHWRKAIKTATDAATAEPDKAKVMIASATTVMDGLRSISELRRGRSYVASPPAQAQSSELASLLKGLVPGEVKRQRKRGKSVDDSEPDTNADPNPSTQKGEG